MGINCGDIDITIDNMSGEAFVKSMHRYFKRQERFKKSERIVSGFGITKFNPDKSKHLETASIKIKD